jgi:hypothetical protein
LPPPPVKFAPPPKNRGAYFFKFHNEQGKGEENRGVKQNSKGGKIEMGEKKRRKKRLGRLF